MIYLRDAAVAFVAQHLKATDFHAGAVVKDDAHYNEAAEDLINAMSNIELLTLLDGVGEQEELTR